MINSRIKIPAGAKNHQEFDTMTVKRDSLLYSVLPHAHYRGKAMKVSVIYPDGEEEVLLSVPNYDFNWQTSYDFKEPVFIPKGSELKQINWWDNSKQNLANPDPSVDVYWGDQSFEEMLFGAFYDEGFERGRSSFCSHFRKLQGKHGRLNYSFEASLMALNSFPSYHLGHVSELANLRTIRDVMVSCSLKPLKSQSSLYSSEGW